VFHLAVCKGFVVNACFPSFREGRHKVLRKPRQKKNSMPPSPRDGRYDTEVRDSMDQVLPLAVAMPGGFEFPGDPGTTKTVHTVSSALPR
jgi:hypothetical protein